MSVAPRVHAQTSEPAPEPAPVSALPAPAASVSAARPVSRLRRFGPLLLLVGGALLGAGAMYGVAPMIQPVPTPPDPSNEKKDEHETVKFAQDKWAAAGIRMETITPGPITDHVWRTGRVEVSTSGVAYIAPLVEGVIVEMCALLGQEVAPGAVLAVLESREVAQAKLEFVRSKVALAAERERASWAQQTAANTTDLVKAVAAGKTAQEIDTEFKDRPIGDRRQTLMTAYAQRSQLRTLHASQKASPEVTPAATIRKTEAEIEAAEAAIRALCEEFRFQATQQARAAELKVKEAEAAFYAARTQLLILGYTDKQLETMNPAAEGAKAARFEVRAPFGGVVVEKHGVRAERVTPQVQMFRVVDLSVVQIQADVFEPDLPLLRKLAGRPVLFRAPLAEIPQQPATVTYAGDLVDRTTRALTLTAVAKNPDRALKPGMFVEVGLPRGDPAPVLWVPPSAVQRHHGKTFVFVHTKDDEFRRVDVKLGREGADRVEVETGLTQGDAVVVGGAFDLKSELFRDELLGE